MVVKFYHVYSWMGWTWVNFKKDNKRQQMDKQTNVKRLQTEDSRQST
jgi:hypothetical protein